MSDRDDESQPVEQPNGSDLPVGKVEVPPGSNAWFGDIMDYRPLIAKAEVGDIDAAMILVREFASRDDQADPHAAYIAKCLNRWLDAKLTATAARKAFNIGHAKAHRPRRKYLDPDRVKMLAIHGDLAAQNPVAKAVRSDTANACHKGVSTVQKLAKNPTPEEELAAGLVRKFKK